MQTTWKIEQMERRSTDDLVTVVHYRVEAVDGEFSASTYGTVSLEAGETFIEFDKLTQRDVISWVQHALDKNTVEASLASQIESQKTPQILQGMPWAN